MGTLWDDASELAELHGVTMTDLVRVAVQRLVDEPGLREILADARTRARRVEKSD